MMIEGDTVNVTLHDGREYQFKRPAEISFGEWCGVNSQFPGVLYIWQGAGRYRFFPLVSVATWVIF